MITQLVESHILGYYRVDTPFESLGSGILRILKKYKKEDFIITANFIRVVLYFNDNVNNGDYKILERKVADKTQEVADKKQRVADKMAASLLQRLEIKEYIADNNKITSQEVQNILLVKGARARRILQQMLNEKEIIRCGSGRATFYELKK